MAKEKFRAPAFDDIVFELRNKEYGAYKLRKRYSRHMLIALLIGIVITCTVVIGPYMNAKAAAGKTKIVREETQVEILMENLDQPTEQVAPPPPPPPPPTEAVQQARYVPPVVVDSLRPEEVVQLVTADQAIATVMDEDVTAVIEIIEEVREEIAEEEPEPEPFIIVEEMPMFPGGDAELLAYINANIVYPEIAKENNIQGRVIIRFCVTSKGTVSQVTVFQGVDPELDAEAVRVVNTLPAFTPGRQGGKPVPVWYTVPITFVLK